MCMYLSLIPVSKYTHCDKQVPPNLENRFVLSLLRLGRRLVRNKIMYACYFMFQFCLGFDRILVVMFRDVSNIATLPCCWAIRSSRNEPCVSRDLIASHESSWVVAAAFWRETIAYSEILPPTPPATPFELIFRCCASAANLGRIRPLTSAESVAVRCYNILFCLLIVMAELEWTTTVREMFVLHSWIPRGIVYSL